MMRPRILLATDVRADARGQSYAAGYLSYVDAIRRAGGSVILAPPEGENLDDLLSLVHGIVIPGGGDIDPALFGEAPHPSVNLVDSRRQTTDLALARAAVVRDIPILGVCLGMQVLGFVTGGSILQDIASSRPDALQHETHGPVRSRHPVNVAAGSRLAALVGEGRGEVNSAHHQALAAVGSRARATAVAPDEVIEAIEIDDLLFCIGVQWHPETMPGERLGDPLFEGLIAAATRYAAKLTAPSGVT